MKLNYFPLYIETREEGGKWTIESGSRPAAEVVVPYAALVMQVELLAGSELRHGAATQLERRGWALAIDPMEEVRYLKSSSREVLLLMESAEEKNMSEASFQDRPPALPRPCPENEQGSLQGSPSLEIQFVQEKENR